MVKGILEKGRISIQLAVLVEPNIEENRKSLLNFSYRNLNKSLDFPSYTGKWLCRTLKIKTKDINRFCNLSTKNILLPLIIF